MKAVMNNIFLTERTAVINLFAATLVGLGSVALVLKALSGSQYASIVDALQHMESYFPALLSPLIISAICLASIGLVFYGRWWRIALIVPGATCFLLIIVNLIIAKSPGLISLLVPFLVLPFWRGCKTSRSS